MSHRSLLLAVTILALALPLAASAVEVEVTPLECIADDHHSVVYAQVTDIPPEATVRVYFRRLHQETEDFYWVEMNPQGNGRYWGVLPKPTDDELSDHEIEDPQNEEEEENPEAAWWRRKDMSQDRDPNDDLDEDVIEERASEGSEEERDWLRRPPLAELEPWFEEVDLEPADYYVAVVDAQGRELATSPMLVTTVGDDADGRDCPDPRLNAAELGQSNNLVIGETAAWQEDRRVFHWQCDGIVSRINYQDILYVDRHCRACAFVWQKGAVPAGVGVLAAILEDDADNPPPEPASPTDPDGP